MSNLWIPMLLGLSNGFGGFNTYFAGCINDYNRYSKKYERYGVDE